MVHRSSQWKPVDEFDVPDADELEVERDDRGVPATSFGEGALAAAVVGADPCSSRSSRC